MYIHTYVRNHVHMLELHGNYNNQLSKLLMIIIMKMMVIIVISFWIILRLTSNKITYNI